jgi:hypothetical protein
MDRRIAIIAVSREFIGVSIGIRIAHVADTIIVHICLIRVRRLRAVIGSIGHSVSILVIASRYYFTQAGVNIIIVYLMAAGFEVNAVVSIGVNEAQWILRVGCLDISEKVNQVSGGLTFYPGYELRVEVLCVRVCCE